MDNSLSLAFEKCGFKSWTISINDFDHVFFSFICLFVHFVLILCINGYFNVNLSYVYGSNTHGANLENNE